MTHRTGRGLVGRHFWHGRRQVVVEFAWGYPLRRPPFGIPPRRVQVRYLDDGTRCVRPFHALTRSRLKEDR